MGRETTVKFGTTSAHARPCWSISARVSFVSSLFKMQCNFCPLLFFLGRSSFWWKDTFSFANLRKQQQVCNSMMYVTMVITMETMVIYIHPIKCIACNLTGPIIIIQDWLSRITINHFKVDFLLLNVMFSVPPLFKNKNVKCGAQDVLQLSAGFMLLCEEGLMLEVLFCLPLLVCVQVSG